MGLVGLRADPEPAVDRLPAATGRRPSLTAQRRPRHPCPPAGPAPEAALVDPAMIEPTLTDEAHACEEAAHAVRAAAAIIADPGARDRDACIHLARAWHLLARVAGHNVPDPRMRGIQAADLLASAQLDRLTGKQRRALDLLLPTIMMEAHAGPTRGPWEVQRSVLVRHTRTLSLLIGASSPPGVRTGYPTGWWVRRVLWWSAIVIAAAGGLAVLLGLA